MDVESLEGRMHGSGGSRVGRDRNARLQADGTGMHHLPSNEADRFVSVALGIAEAVVEGLAGLCRQLRFEMRSCKVFVS